MQPAAMKRWGVRLGVYLIALYSVTFDGLFALVLVSDTLKTATAQVTVGFLQITLQAFLWSMIGVSCWAIINSIGLVLLKEWARKSGIALAWVGLGLGVYAILGNLATLLTSGALHQPMMVIIIGSGVKVAQIGFLTRTTVRHVFLEAVS